MGRRVGSLQGLGFIDLYVKFRWEILLVVESKKTMFCF